MAHWGIVGGGLLGMTLAHRLRQQGQRVTLLEAGESLGGLASAWSVGDVTWDRHYHVILHSDSHLRALLAEIGLESELRWSQTKTGFYTAGKLYSMSSALEFLSFPPLNAVEKIRLAATIFYASRIRDWKPLERELVADWLERWSGRGTCEKIWLPLLRAKLGECYKRTSAAFIWATIARMYAARRSGLKKEMFGYVRGGYARILDRFTQVLQEAGVAIELAAPASACFAERRRQGRGVVRGEPACGVRPGRDDRARARRAPDLPGSFRGRGRQAARHRVRRHRLRVAAVEEAAVAVTTSRTSPTPWVPFTAVIEMSALVDRERVRRPDPRLSAEVRFAGRSVVLPPRPGDRGRVPRGPAPHASRILARTTCSPFASRGPGTCSRCPRSGTPTRCRRRRRRSPAFRSSTPRTSSTGPSTSTRRSAWPSA